MTWRLSHWEFEFTGPLEGRGQWAWCGRLRHLHPHITSQILRFGLG